MPNPNIAEAGKNTRFQAGNAAAKDRNTKPSIRNWARYYGAQPMETDDWDQHWNEQLAKASTFAQIIAIQIWKKSYLSDRAWNKLVRLTDGPIPTAKQVEWEQVLDMYTGNECSSIGKQNK